MLEGSIMKLLSTVVLIFSLLIGCKNKDSTKAISEKQKDSLDLCCGLPSRGSHFPSSTALSLDSTSTVLNKKGMVLIKGGVFRMGGRDQNFARKDEFPVHSVRISSFYLDEHEVTNAQFKRFVSETAYKTLAERPLKWEELKKNLPPGTPKPAADFFEAGSLVFNQPRQAVPLNNPLVWWNWQKGCDWMHPNGPESSIEGMDNFPVVHIVYEDAMAYCAWAGKRLPSEAEWEYAARGGNDDFIYPWGNEKVDVGRIKTNSWQGNFPNYNSLRDGFEFIAPVQQFEPNPLGLYDMAGNVWELCNDWYHTDYYTTFQEGSIVENPIGPSSSFDPLEPTIQKKVIRGGSFLCNDSYCSGYRAAARMKMALDSSAPHIGFRCAAAAISN